MIAVKCWYCHKDMPPGGWDWIVLQDGTQRPVCKDDRQCKAGTGIRGNGQRPPTRRQPKNKALQKARKRDET